MIASSSSRVAGLPARSARRRVSAEVPTAPRWEGVMRASKCMCERVIAFTCLEETAGLDPLRPLPSGTFENRASHCSTEGSHLPVTVRERPRPYCMQWSPGEGTAACRDPRGGGPRVTAALLTRRRRKTAGARTPAVLHLRSGLNQPGGFEPRFPSQYHLVQATIAPQFCVRVLRTTNCGGIISSRM